MVKLYRNLLIMLTMFFCINSLKAEIIKNEDVNTQKFGIWNVSCKEDQMLDKIECKIFAEITDQSIIFLNPLNKENMITVISKDIMPNSQMLVKVDKNQLFNSLEYKGNEFGNVDFTIDDKINIFNDIQNGQSLFFRFFTANSKEITVKLSLKDLQKALNFFNSKMLSETTTKSDKGVNELETKPVINLKKEKIEKAN